MSCRVHEARLVPDPIIIVESDPMWPAEFERLLTPAPFEIVAPNFSKLVSRVSLLLV